MPDSSPPPRSSKRRKITTYASDRSTATSPNVDSPSMLYSLSSVVSGISRRLFEPHTKPTTKAPQAEPTEENEVSSLEGKKGFQETAHAQEKQPCEETHDAAAGIGSLRSHKKEAAVQVDVVTPAGKTKKPRRSTKDFTEEKQFERNLSAHKKRPVEPQISNSAKSIGVGTIASLNDKLAESPRKGKPGMLASASHKKAEMSRDETSIAREGETVVAYQRSSGREKRRPRRYSADVESKPEQHRKQSMTNPTPSKRNRNVSRKSAAHEDEEEEGEEQFKLKSLEEPSRSADNAKRKKKTKPSIRRAEPKFNPLGMHLDTVQVGQDNLIEEDDLIVQNTVQSLTLPAIDAASNITHTLDSTEEEDDDPHLTAIKAIIISRLTNSSLVPLTNFATEYVKLNSLLKATVAAGEGNSILVLGARGSGKTTLVETALADVSLTHAAEFHVVRLSGFQQTDDKVALREIWRQLGKEMQVEEEETNQVSSYADTMASLLHLLSHPEELVEVLESSTTSTTTKSVVFVLDEFDLFATHPRQTLLYNLFDIAQAKKAPIAVIGCSTRVDIVESLEKRVKSRFSHRWIHLSQPKSYQAFEAVIESALCLDVPEGDVLDSNEKTWRAAWNEYMRCTFIPSPSVRSILRQTFYTTKSIPAAFSSLYLLVASITSLDRLPKAPVNLAYVTPPDSTLLLLPSLSPLHLCLLISAARLDAIHNASVVNFNLVYQHYVELSSRTRLQSSASGALAQGGLTKIWGKEIAKSAWENLGDWEILVPAALGKSKGDDAPETKMWRVDVTLEEVGACLDDVGTGLGDVLGKWCKEV